MNTKLVEDIANAVLYEGYLLYPYRASAVKNQQRWNFGVLYPRAFSESQRGSDAWSMQSECLVRATDTGASLRVRVCFLQLIDRRDSQQSSQEGTERDARLEEIDLAGLVSMPAHRAFTFSADCEGIIEAEAENLADGLFKIRVRVCNTASLEDADRASREKALLRSLVSAHAILHIEGGEFISLLDPPDELRETAAQCKNVGVWPVLVGEQGTRDAMLCSPIILYDYPQIAPESPGALFDGTEIDEILTLRIMTLTEDEKLEMGQGDERARQILERTESLPPEQLMKMHGALRGLQPADRETP